MTAPTEAQAAVLAALPAWGERGMSARQVAKAAWPNDPGWDRVTAGHGASRHNGAKGATMPLRAGRVLRALADLRLAEHLDEGPRSGLWTRAYAAPVTIPQPTEET